MSVKEYFDSNANPVVQGYVFVLLTEKTRDVYENYVKKAADYLEFRCESFLDLKGGGDALNDILARIQKAEVLIYDISDFTPNVMWELGVGLTIKDADKVIVIREKSDAPLPFNIYSHRVSYQYDRDDQEDLNRLRDTLVDVMRGINRANIRDNPIESPEVRKLIENAIKAVGAKDWPLAEILFESMDRTEPENWHIFNQWGIMLRSKDEFESAINKFNLAIQYAKFEDEKAYVYTELAILFQMNRRTTEAEQWFRKAEQADSKNKHLYIAWAEFYDELRDHFKAQAMILGVLGKLSENDSDFKEIKLRHDYYNVKIDDAAYNKTFEEFRLEQELRKREHEAQIRREKNRDSRPRDLRPPQPRWQPGPGISERIPWDISWEDFSDRYTGATVEGTVSGTVDFGVFVRLSKDLSGLIFRADLAPDFRNRFSINEPVTVRVQQARLDRDTGRPRISLGLAEHTSPVSRTEPKKPVPQPTDQVQLDSSVLEGGGDLIGKGATTNDDTEDHRTSERDLTLAQNDPEDLKLRPLPRFFKLSVFHPKLLSKRFEAIFVVSIFFPENRTEMTLAVELEQDIGEPGFKEYKEYTSNTRLTRSNKVVVELGSHYVDFTPAKVAKELRDNVNTISFHGTPKDTCQPGNHTIIISLSDQETGQQYQSGSFKVRVVDFAFDHMPRPLISKIVSSGLALGSLVTFLLTLFGKIDNTFGLASGTVGAALAAFVHSRFILLFQKPHQSSIGES